MKAPFEMDVNWKLWWIWRTCTPCAADAFELAADIAAKHRDAEFMKWGVKLAFDHACDAGSLADAREVARRHNLDKAALKRVALLVNKKI